MKLVLAIALLACKSDKPASGSAPITSEARRPQAPAADQASARPDVPPAGSAMTFSPDKAPEYIPDPIGDLPELPPASTDKPSPAVVDAVKGLCALGDKSPPETKGALAAWLAANAENLEMATLFNDAMAKHDKLAIAKLRAAGDAAAGAGKCEFLDFMLKMSLRGAQ